MALIAALLAFTSAMAAPVCVTDDLQADFQSGVAVGIDLNSSPGDAILQRGAVVDQENNTMGTNGVGITTTTWGGQTFTPGVSGDLTRVDMHLFCSGCTGTTPDLTLSLRATSGGLPTGTDLASATITGFSSGRDEVYTAAFASPPTVSAGVQYAWVIRPVANPSPGTYALTRSGTATAGSDVYTAGTRVSGPASGTTWSVPLTGGVSTDAGFKVYIDSGYAAAGSLSSSVRDSGAPDAGRTPMWTGLSWSATAPPNTQVAFQLAGSNASNGPFDFVGPDGTSATTYTADTAPLSQFNGLRYLKYKALLVTSDTGLTPTLHSVSACYDQVLLPAVSSLAPQSGAPSGGNAVVVTGTGFLGASQVRFGAVAASSFTVNSDTQITAVAPAGTVGVVDVTVTTAAGTSVTSASDQYWYVVRQTSGIPTAVGGQTLSAQIVSGSAGCSIDLSRTMAFTPPAFGSGTPPYGGLKLVLVGCQNAETVRVSITWPDVSGLALKKFGKTPTLPSTDSYYDPANISVSGNTVSYDITDNGLGDDTFTGADGVINDPAVMVMAMAGPAPAPAAIPTLSHWALIGLSMLLGMVGFHRVRRRQA